MSREQGLSGVNGQPYQHDFPLDDEIDLRQLAVTIFRRWKVIAGGVALVVAAVTVLNAFVLSPSYETSTVVMFRNDEPALDMDFHAFQALSSSSAVMSNVRRRVGQNWSVAELTRRFKFQAEDSVPMMTVTATAEDPHLSVRLINHWIAAVRAEALRTMERRLSQTKSIVEANYQSLMQALAQAEEGLAAFDREHPIALMEAALQRDMERLVAEEELLDTLKHSTIPTNEATVVALRKALAEESPTFDSNLLVLPRVRGDMQFQQLNPTYVELRQRLTALESSLAADRRQVELLEESLPAFRAQVNEANTALIDAKLQRERLERELVEARALVEEVRAERDEILALERHLPNLSRVEVVSGPVLPDQPVSPRKMLNLAIAAMLGLMVSVFGVLVVEWWRSPIDAETAVQTQTLIGTQAQTEAQTQVGRA